MKPFSLLVILIFIGSCASSNSRAPMASPPIEISTSETLHAHELLLSIMDGKSETLPCIEDPEEAAILLKTLDPEYEEILDSYQAKLDDDKEVQQLIQNCEKDCTCLFINSLLEENEIPIEKAVKKDLKLKMSGERHIACSQKMTNQFCESSLYKKIEKEKLEFKLD